LTPGLYNDFTLSFSKNMLNSCSKNAILFTFGDGDTFPLLYLQSQYGIRTDVLVVNLSLLQTSRYINSLRNKILDAEPLPISFSPEEINGDKKEVILIDSKGEINKPIELSKMIAFISDDHNTIEYPGKNYSYINTNNFQLTTSNTTLNLQTDARYFQRNDLILYDVLANTKMERSIYFAATSSGDSFLKMNNFLQLEGLTYKLTDKVQKKYDNLEFAEINTSLLYKNLMTNFDWKGLDAITSNERTICWAYRSCFQLLFNKLLEEEKPDYAELVLDKYMEEMPNNVMHFDLYTIAVIEGYYKLNKIKKGNEIAKILIYNIDHNIDNYEGLTYSHNSKDWKKTTSEYLKTILETYKQTDLLKELH
ncbi:MAG: hypothetical protein NTX97_05325, partial [Bacteroidetes bacterium]|nr:hypothetical protein [Bacteroidota bacterium]